MNFRRALVLGAHPDDEMGCAGLIYRLRLEQSEVKVVAFSECSDLNGPGLLREWNNALRLLGVEEFELLNFSNRELPDYRQNILNHLDGLRMGGFDLVLCPSTQDVHQDHATVAQEARRAFKHTTVLGYELPLNHVGPARLDAYVKLDGDDIDAKLAHVAAYRSQEHKPYMNPDYVEALARVRGVQAGTTYAEAYEVIRWVM
jgi:LmbE family N-acetylglucosaminyl deacetylase